MHPTTKQGRRRRGTRAGARSWSSTRLLVVLTALAAVALVGCGGEDGGDEAASSDTTRATTSPVVRHHELTPEEIEVYQQDLDDVGCWAGPVDGVLGPRTEAALREFQEASGIPVTGLLGGESEIALTDAAANGETVCAGGDDQQEARAPTDAGIHELEVWQHDLNVVGCWAGAEDGRLGPQTTAAIRAFQAAVNLPVTGQLDAETEQILAEAAAEMAPGGSICATPAAGSGGGGGDDGGGAVAGSGGGGDDGGGALDGAGGDDGGGAVADAGGDDGGGAVAGSCQVTAGESFPEEGEAEGFVAELAGAGFRGFAVGDGETGYVVIKAGLSQTQADRLVSRLEATGYSGSRFC